MSYAGVPEEILDLLRLCARHPGVRHQDIAIAATLPYQSFGFSHFVGHVRGAQRTVAPARELALNDKPAAEVLIACWIPVSGEGAVPAAIVRIEERFHRLAEKLSRNRET